MNFESKHRQYFITGLIGGALLLFAACSAKSAGETAPDASKKTDAMPPPQVKTLAVTERPVTAYLETTGSLIALQSAKVVPEKSGIVESIPIENGDFVKEGTIIAHLRDRESVLRLEQARAAEQEAEAALKQAQSRLGIAEGATFDPQSVAEVQSAKANLVSAESAARLAEANFKRYELLAKNDNVSKVVYDQARNQVETARAAVTAAQRQLDVAMKVARQDYQAIAAAQAALAQAKTQVALAQKNLDDMSIHVPFTSFVASRLVTKGEYVATDTPLAVVVRPDPLKLTLQLPETEAAKIKPGQTVTARTDAYPEREFTGKIKAINPQVDQQARALTVEAMIDNPDHTLRPGMFMKARILLPSSHPGFFVPRPAVFFNSAISSSCLYVLEGDHVRLRVVQIGESAGEETQVLSGLTSGESVVIENPQQLFDGMKVALGN